MQLFCKRMYRKEDRDRIEMKTLIPLESLKIFMFKITNLFWNKIIKNLFLLKRNFQHQSICVFIQVFYRKKMTKSNDGFKMVICIHFLDLNVDFAFL